MKVLQICVDLDGGGIDRYLFNYCSRISNIQFDFVIVDNGKVGILEEPIKVFGGKIYRVPRQRGSLKKNYLVLKKIMTENTYDAVHVHLGYKSAVALLCAKNCGIKTRIAHAHIAYEPENFKQKIIRKIFSMLSKRYATSLLSCGADAGAWVWGKRCYRRGKVTIMNNAIETERYAYSSELRMMVRNDLGIAKDTFVVGHVGRLCEQKNQLRLLDIFNEINKKVSNSLLILVGRGAQEKEIQDKIKRLGLEGRVKLLGVRNDVHALLNAFDVFVFPSTHEGLPFTLIETQCNGLPALSADTVTRFCKVGDCVDFLSLNVSDEVWATESLKLVSKGRSEEEYKNIAEQGYDIDVQAKRLEEYYYHAIEGNVQ